MALTPAAPRAPRSPLKRRFGGFGGFGACICSVGRSGRAPFVPTSRRSLDENEVQEDAASSVSAMPCTTSTPSAASSCARSEGSADGVVVVAPRTRELAEQSPAALASACDVAVCASAGQPAPLASGSGEFSSSAFASDLGSTPAPPPEAAEALPAAPPAERVVVARSAVDVPAADLADAALEGKIRELMALRDGRGPAADLSDFAKEYGDEAFCRRLLRKYDGDMRRCTCQYTAALRWRERNRELLSTRRFKLSTDVRVIGADRQQRSVVYTCLKNMVHPMFLDQAFVTMLQAIDNLPRGVEKTVHIWDCHGMKLRMSLDPTPTARWMQAQECYFAERLHELIIIDMPPVAAFIKRVVWPLVPEKTRRKVRFISVDEARLHIQTECDEATAQRVCHAIAENRDESVSFEERLQSWRRVNQEGALVPLGP